MKDMLLTINGVSSLLGVSRSTIWNWANPKSRHHRHDFPKPIKLSDNIPGWLSSEIDDYISKLAANRKE